MNNEIKRMLKFENVKLFNNKKFIKKLILIIFSIFLFFTILFIFEETRNQDIQFDNDQIIEMYKNRLEVINEEIIGEPEGLKKQNLLKEKLKLEFFIETNSTEYDTIPISNIGDKIYKFIGTSYMFYMFNKLYFVLIILTIFISIIIFLYDVETNYIKNICSSQINRKNIIIGKILFCQILLSLVFLLLIIILIIPGLFNLHSNLLVYDGSKYYTMNALLSFIIQSLGLYLLCSVILVITNMLIIMTKKTSFVILIILYVFATLLLISHILDKSIKLNSTILSSDYYIVLFNIPYIFKYINYYTIYWIIFYVLIIYITIILTIKIFNKHKF